MEAPKKRYISPEEKQQIIDELRLVKKCNHGKSKNSKFLRQHSCTQQSCAQCIKSIFYISKNSDADSEMEVGRTSSKDVPKRRYISPEEKQQIIDELGLV